MFFDLTHVNTESYSFTIAIKYIFEKSFIQPFIRYYSHFIPLGGTGNLPWPMDYLS